MMDFSKGYYKFFIDQQLPDLNSYVNACRGNSYKANNMKKKAEQVVKLCAERTLQGVKITHPVFMRYTWIEPNKRKDLDNIAHGKKYVQDALVKAGILQGDGWRHVIGFEDKFEIDKENPGVLVEIVEVY
jgi:Holliday junction resolvase RusA-like endonuclease